MRCDVPIIRSLLHRRGRGWSCQWRGQVDPDSSRLPRSAGSPEVTFTHSARYLVTNVNVNANANANTPNKRAPTPDELLHVRSLHHRRRGIQTVLPSDRLRRRSGFHPPSVQ